MLEREIIDRDLRQAKAALEEFLAAIDDERLLARLAWERPAHPLVFGFRVSLGVMAALIVFSIASLGAPMLGYQVARAVADASRILTFPLPLALLLLGYCFGMMGVSLRWFAIQRARTSPMLAEERRRHDALVEDLRRLHAQLREVEQRAVHHSA